MVKQKIEIRPQDGFQLKFLQTPADIAIGGGSAGSGKAGSNKSQVMTELGTKTMGEIRPGDWVLNPDGRKTEVINTFPQGVKDIYRVLFDDDSYYDCTSDHLWVAWQARKTSKRARNKHLIQEDLSYKLYPESAKIHSTSTLRQKVDEGKSMLIPCTNPVIFHNVYQNGIKLDPYTLGIILGDGGLTQNRISVSSADKEIWDHLIKDEYDLSPLNKYTRVLYKKNKGIFLYQEIERLELLGLKSENKFIPKSYLFGTIQDRESILQGLLDTDGYVGEKSTCIEFTTVSELLSKDITTLVQSLGGKVTTRHKIGSYKKDGIRKMCLPVYRLTIKLPKIIKPFRLKRKVLRYRTPTLRVSRKIKSITFLEKYEATCILVSNPNRLYLGDQFIVTHNTFIELMEPLRHQKNPNFGAIIFRRSYPEIMMQGGLWDEAGLMYPRCGAYPNKADTQWSFISGAKVTFRHMQSERVLDEYQGAQIPLIEFDEMTHFTRRMFVYMLSRNRQGSCEGVRPYLRGTCNPDPDSWLAEFLEWWIDQESGFPIPEHAGKIRYMVADQDQFVWGTTKEEVFEKAPHVFTSDAVLKTGISREQLVKSVTFIPGSIYENKELLRKDPGYVANLLAQDEATQARLLHGNWKIRTDKQNLFDFLRLNDMFFNLIPPNQLDEYYISIDHAREGRDFCVIGTWHGWRCIRVDILPKSDTKDILRVVDFIRRTYGGIPTSNIIIDQDGIGVKDFLECHTFFGGSSENEAVNELPSFKRIGDKFQKRGYRNKRGQLYYLLSEKVNAADIYIDLENVWFHYDQLKIERVHAIKIGNKEFLIKDLFKEDLRTVRKKITSNEKIKEIISKEEHKIALGGRSPDFGDMLMMRCQFEFIRKKKYMKS